MERSGLLLSGKKNLIRDAKKAKVFSILYSPSSSFPRSIIANKLILFTTVTKGKELRFEWEQNKFELLKEVWGFENWVLKTTSLINST